MNKVIEQEDGKILVVHSCGGRTLYPNRREYEAAAALSKVALNYWRNSGLFADTQKMLRQSIERNPGEHMFIG